MPDIYVKGHFVRKLTHTCTRIDTHTHTHTADRLHTRPTTWLINNVNICAVSFTHLISSDLISSDLSALWSDPVRRGCDQSYIELRTYFVSTGRSALSSDEMRSDEMRWDEWYERSIYRTWTLAVLRGNPGTARNLVVVTERRMMWLSPCMLGCGVTFDRRCNMSWLRSCQHSSNSNDLRDAVA